MEDCGLTQWTPPLLAVNVNVIEQEISSHASLTLLGWKGREREREREREMRRIFLEIEIWF